MLVFYQDESLPSYVALIMRVIVDGIINNTRVGAAADLIEDCIRKFPDAPDGGFAVMFAKETPEILLAVQQCTPWVNLYAEANAHAWINKLKAELQVNGDTVLESSEIEV